MSPASTLTLADLQRQIDFTAATLLQELPAFIYPEDRPTYARLVPVLVGHLLADTQAQLDRGQTPTFLLHTGPHPLIGLLYSPHGPGGIVLVQELSNVVIYLATHDPSFRTLAGQLTSRREPESWRHLRLVKLVAQIQALMLTRLPLDKDGTFLAFNRDYVLTQEVQRL
ncbi:hypothetical protein [Deinococcus planocerae]|uniref:hypothetical protein n=1 Tax=Deinococcus planocerae TaxID=1737569 RepID=UPI000C7F2E2F|nr:hypothetical protein [Deinococcus planocerae]